MGVLEGKFEDNVVIQIKYGPIDFQVREPASPLFGAMPNTNQSIELQVTQEYTGQQRHLQLDPPPLLTRQPSSGCSAAPRSSTSGWRSAARTGRRRCSRTRRATVAARPSRPATTRSPRPALDENRH